MAEGKGGINAHLLLTIVAAALGSGFQHGYHTGVINVPGEILRTWENDSIRKVHGSYLNESDFNIVWSTSTSIINVGGMIGGLLTGVIVNKLGPRLSLMFNNILVVIACLLMSYIAKLSSSVESFIVGRFLIGINAGLNAGLCPMYLSEISPVSLRGAIASVYQLVITITIVLAMILGLDDILGSKKLWPILFLLPVAFAAFQVITLLFCPDSPKYLICTKGDVEKAEKGLKWLRKSDDVEQELSELKAEDAANKALPKVTLKDMFKNSSLRTPLMISATLMVAQQFSGINAIVFYSTSSFEEGKLSHADAQYATIGIFVVNVLMTVVSVYLVEIAGRKTLLLVGFGGMTVITALISLSLHFTTKVQPLSYVSIALVVIYIILFAAGAGSIPWFLVTEIFNQAARPTAVSLAVPVNWLANFIVTLSFLPIQEHLKSWVFFFFTGFNVLFFVFIWKIVPETKNKSIEEITSLFK